MAVDKINKGGGFEVAGKKYTSSCSIPTPRAIRSRP